MRKSTAVLVQCEYCKREFRRVPSRIRYAKNFCSQQCSGMASRGAMTPRRMQKIAAYRRYYAREQWKKLEFKKKLLSIINPKWNNKKYLAKLEETRNERKRLQTKRAQLAYICRKSGITLPDYLSMVESQDGCCAICGLVPSKGRLYIDHCHKTGMVRGLLCHKCNVALGLLDEDQGRMYAAIRYLKYQENTTVIRG